MYVINFVGKKSKLRLKISLFTIHISLKGKNLLLRNVCTYVLVMFSIFRWNFAVLHSFSQKTLVWGRSTKMHAQCIPKISYHIFLSRLTNLFVKITSIHTCINDSNHKFQKISIFIKKFDEFKNNIFNMSYIKLFFYTDVLLREDKYIIFI